MKVDGEVAGDALKECGKQKLEAYGGLAGAQSAEQKRYFESKMIYAMQIESTDACDQGCIYCYAGSTPQERNGLTSDEIRGLLADAAALDIRAIDWLGGDPLLRRDWYELMVEARSLGLINNVWTSGLPLSDEEVARRVVEVTAEGFVSVHVDSITPEVYARLHQGGHAENIATITAGVDRLLRLGKPADRMINCITYTARQGPQDAAATMRWWFEEKGLRTCLTMFNPAGMGAGWRSLEPSLEETRRVYEVRDRLNYDVGTTIGAMDTDKYYCGTLVTVTYTGEVTPCSVIREGVDNIRRTPFRDIITAHRETLVHASLHDTCNLPQPCNLCAHNDHCWGCRSSAYNYTGDVEAVDPKCWLIAANWRVPG
jgi:radical SAM protein with 4Fe4S-binding SPASM domain